MRLENKFPALNVPNSKGKIDSAFLKLLLLNKELVKFLTFQI